MSSRIITGISDVADEYDAFVFDQFGVLHDGTSLYQNVLAVLEGLHEKKKKILVLSNSGRSGQVNLDRILSFGIHKSWINGVITSGDVAKSRVLGTFWQKKAAKCYLLASPNEDPSELLKAVPGLHLVDRVSECDFVYLSGMATGLAATWERELLPELLFAGVPLVCSNPDMMAPSKDGLIVSTGTIAKAYQEAGGDVTFVGKPHGLVYEVLQEELQILGCDRALCIGDSYHHDVMGAHQADLDSLLVLTGIHGQLFAGDDIAETLASKLVENGIFPTLVSRTL